MRTVIAMSALLLIALVACDAPRNVVQESGPNATDVDAGFSDEAGAFDKKGGACNICALDLQSSNQDCSGVTNRPNYIVDYSGTSDACCQNASAPYGNCFVHTPCDTNDAEWCPTSGSNEWMVERSSGVDTCLERAPACDDEWECGAGCSASNCFYIDTGEKKCEEGSGCGLNCGSQNVFIKRCPCSGGTCEVYDQHLGCGNSF